MEMDYIVDKWLYNTVEYRWQPNRTQAVLFAAGSTCAVGGYSGPNDWYCGQGYGLREHLHLNYTQWQAASTIRAEHSSAAAAGKSYQALGPKIDQAKVMIGAMNQAEADLLTQFPNRMRNTARRIITQNLGASLPDKKSPNGAGLCWQFLLNNSPTGAGFADACFEIMKPGEEDAFMQFADLPPAATEFQTGVDVWYVKSGVAEGFQRQYRQLANVLVAEWWYYARQWHWTGWPGSCQAMGALGQFRNATTAQEYWDDRYVSAQAKPYRLKPGFFGRGGSLVVAVGRRMNNPLQIMMKSGQAPGTRGVFNFFTVNNDNRLMYAVSAARAGYHVQSQQNPWSYNSPPVKETTVTPGLYATSWVHPKIGNWTNFNLKFSDWDAMLIPVGQAWSDAVNGNYGARQPGVLSRLFSAASWESLDGTPPPTTVTGPPGMFGGNPDWNGLEARLMH